jgi:hypothetical protein
MTADIMGEHSAAAKVLRKAIEMEMAGKTVLFGVSGDKLVVFSEDLVVEKNG